MSILAQIASALNARHPIDRMEQPFPPIRGRRPPTLQSPQDLPDVDRLGLQEDAILGVDPERGREQISLGEMPMSMGDVSGILGALGKNAGALRGVSASTKRRVGAIPRTDPDLIAEKNFFHGTGNPNIRAEEVDPFFGSHEGLFGNGFYITDERAIAEGYAGGSRRTSRSGEAATVFGAKVTPEKVLDLEEPIPANVANVFRKRGQRAYDEGEGIVEAAVEAALAKKGATSESVFKAFQEGIRDASQELRIPSYEYVQDFQELSVNLREIGYDALTHTGGKRTGNKAHQVLIMLDPQDAYSGVGRAGQIKSLEPRPKALHGDELLESLGINPRP